MQSRAVDGAATEAALRAVAAAIGVPRRQVCLVTGARSRDKLVEVSDPPRDIDDRLRALLDG